MPEHAGFPATLDRPASAPLKRLKFSSTRRG
jgi:hypothetical protein